MTTFDYIRYNSKDQPMKMKFLFTAILALLFSCSCFSQKSMLKLQIGYGIPLTSTQATQNVQSTSSSTTYTGVYGNYGSGLSLEAGYIQPLSSHLYLELDATYLIGKSINSTYTSSSTTQRQSASSLFYEVSPLLRVSLGGDKIRPYAAVGPVVGFGAVTANNISSNSNTINASENERKYNGSAAIGAKSVVGAELTQGRFIFYAQITMIAMSYAPSKSEYTKYTLNGVDQLSNLTINQKQSVYNSSVTVTNNPPDPNQPSEQLKFYLAFSSISMNVGMMFRL